MSGKWFVSSEGSVDDLNLGTEETEKEQHKKTKNQKPTNNDTKILKLYLVEMLSKSTIQLTDKLFI